MNGLSLVVAFFAGIISFLSPCVLPIIPGFLAYLAGTTVAEAKARRRDVFINSIFFVLGFSLVFATLGVLLNTVLEAAAYDVQQWLSRIGGALIIFFGLYLTGLIHVPWLERGHTIKVDRQTRSKYLTSILFGAAFAAGWTPCVGVVLGAILGLAASQPGSAFSLLMAYSLGLSLPFIIVGFFAGEASRAIQKISRWSHLINVVFGVLLIAVGILVFTGTLSRIANFDLLNRFLLQP